MLGRKFEAELKALISSLESDGSLHAVESVDVERSHMLGISGPMPDVLSFSKDVVIDLAKVAIPALFTFLAGWLARSSRRVRLKIGDTELEAESEKQLKELMLLVKELRGAKKPDIKKKKKSADSSR